MNFKKWYQKGDTIASPTPGDVVGPMSLSGSNIRPSKKASSSRFPVADSDSVIPASDSGMDIKPFKRIPPIATDRPATVISDKPIKPSTPADLRLGTNSAENSEWISPAVKRQLQTYTVSLYADINKKLEEEERVIDQIMPFVAEDEPTDLKGKYATYENVRAIMNKVVNGESAVSMSLGKAKIHPPVDSRSEAFRKTKKAILGFYRNKLQDGIEDLIYQKQEELMAADSVNRVNFKKNYGPMKGPWDS